MVEYGHLYQPHGLHAQKISLRVNILMTLSLNLQRYYK